MPKFIIKYILKLIYFLLHNMSLLLNKTNYKLTQYAAETMIYFERHKLIEIAKRILVECALERPQNVQLWIGENIKRIANAIYQDCLHNGKNGLVDSLHLSAHYLYRAVLFGRRGSGRKTQALYLAKRFNLVFLDAGNLIYQHLRGDDEHPNDPLDRELQRAFYYDNCKAKGKALADIIARRLLENDCLSQGWVLINFPNTLEDFKEVLERFKIPPNKLVYLKCCEKTCMRRLVARPNVGQPYNTCVYFEHEMRFFSQFESEINDYLSRRHETIYVDAEANSHDVKTSLFTLIGKSPYLMGFRMTI